MSDINRVRIARWFNFLRACFPWGFLYFPLMVASAVFKVESIKIFHMGEKLKLASCACVKLPDGNRLFFRPLTFDQAIVIDIYFYHAYDKVFSPEKGDFVVDAGAHIGVFTVKAARKVGKQGRVVAFEPSSENYALLKRNSELNCLRNIIPIEAALSDHTGTAALYSYPSHSGGFSIVEHHSAKSVEVPILAIDEVWSKLGYDKIDFLKIDVEGAELEVLFGAKETLEKSSAKIVVAGYHASNDPRRILEFVKSLGYKVSVSKNCFIYGWK